MYVHLVYMQYITGAQLSLYSISAITTAGKNRFLGKILSRFLRLQCIKKTGHKIRTQEEHSIHHSLCYIVFCKL